MKLFTMILLSFIFILGGCQANNEEKNLVEQGNENDDHILQVRDSELTEETHASNQEIAEHLASLANRVPDVEGATAIIAGPYAAVGIDVDEKLDRSRVGTIKFAVTEALQDDPYGKTAIVIADADGTERIRAMARNVRSGDPIHGITEELAAIIGRYMPEFPINTPKATDEEDLNKKTINEKEEQKLEEIEEEQSNHHLNNEE
ncbi:putative lipoprotein YlaJ [Paraliobacillus quinghaiensis]|uniref:Lipoprotein YlaJ n=1 Tax=Paraliobacillus quinghaiensis TaxID=470815 RepID=A0A917TFF3_9BACI|nr:YhcN/YlaJ family sporulation lipoprotein [Paraliobacillus quinghaiensis]GGM20367.1 putative lipoprotein YlaJ [Paraliobacillus quinghaiensis]